MRTPLLRLVPCFAVRRKGASSTGASLEDLTIEGGKWQYTRRLHEDFAAKFWGIDLERWYTLDEDIRAEHIAVYEIENEMRAYDEQDAERKRSAK